MTVMDTIDNLTDEQVGDVMTFARRMTDLTNEQVRDVMKFANLMTDLSEAQRADVVQFANMMADPEIRRIMAYLAADVEEPRKTEIIPVEVE